MKKIDKLVKQTNRNQFMLSYSVCAWQAASRLEHLETYRGLGTFLTSAPYLTLSRARLKRFESVLLLPQFFTGRFSPVLLWKSWRGLFKLADRSWHVVHPVDVWPRGALQRTQLPRDDFIFFQTGPFWSDSVRSSRTILDWLVKWQWIFLLLTHQFHPERFAFLKFCVQSTISVASSRGFRAKDSLSVHSSPNFFSVFFPFL